MTDDVYKALEQLRPGRIANREQAAGILASYQGAYNAQLAELAADFGIVFTGYHAFHYASRAFCLDWLLMPQGGVYPSWIAWVDTGRSVGWRILQPEMCAALKRKYHLHRYNKQWYDDNGALEDDKVKGIIAQSVQIFFSSKIASICSGLYDLLCIACRQERPEAEPLAVYLPGGVTVRYGLDGSMTVNHEPDAFTVNRLKVAYNPDAKADELLKYLDSIFYRDDLQTVLEYLAYTLLQTTRAQTALFIKGEGGNGKSRLSAMMINLLGASCISGTLAKLIDAEDRFTRAQLDNKLLFLDDDLNTAGIVQTGLFKKVVTADVPLMVQRKGVDPYEIKSYAKIVCMGNDFPLALHDRSDGFFRRLLLVKCKPKDPGRVDDTDLQSKLDMEAQGFLMILLNKLPDLIKRGFKFEPSERSRQQVEMIRNEADPAAVFAADEDWIVFDDKSRESKKALVKAFQRWADDNAVTLPAEYRRKRDLIDALVKRGCEERRVNGYCCYAGVRLVNRVDYD